MDIANSIYILKNQIRSLSLRNHNTGASASFTRNRKSTWSMASSVNMLFSCILYLAVCTVCLAADDDKCQSFAGGSVFPQETKRTSGHAIQWSQAVSKFSSTCIRLHSAPSEIRIIWITVFARWQGCQSMTLRRVKTFKVMVCCVLK